MDPAGHQFRSIPIGDAWSMVTYVSLGLTLFEQKDELEMAIDPLTQCVKNCCPFWNHMKIGFGFP